MDACAAKAGASQSPLGIICGGGGLPLQVAAAVARSGRGVFLMGIRGRADPAIEKYPHAWFHLGQVRSVRAALEAAGCREFCMVGHVSRLPLTSLRLDWVSLRMLPRLQWLYRGGDDQVMRLITELVEPALGMKVVGIRDVAADMLAGVGPFGRRRPSASDQQDVRYGLEVLAALGPFDIGQAVVVAQRHVLAVEAVEGTDAMLQRVAAARGQGRISSPAGAGVLVKAPKAGQDLRLDLPVIGPSTVENAIAAGLAGIAVAAGSVIVAEPERLVALADEAHLFIMGVPAAGA
ncbi:MAG: UDP-2,3-diacylglucosamine diphosphatase LpxI [Variibacter sp.]|nr:UDP-2,3-diacylglucosamine diphosphatase LpxI [Variibacter sp.]